MIRFHKVSKAFSDRWIFKELSFTVEASQIVYILGLSGTGKSVLLKNIVGLMRPDAGEIWVDGDPVHRFSEDEMASVRRRCGMVFQQPALFDGLTVMENVAFGLRRLLQLSESEIGTRVQESLALVGLKGIADRWVHDLSYGQKKRVSLARTIATRPKILLFDEPTTGLDPISTHQVDQLILDLSRQLGTTSMVVSHDMGSALRVADHIMVLDGGGLLTQGSPQELQQSRIPLVQEFLAEVGTR